MAACLIGWGGWSLYQSFNPKDPAAEEQSAAIIAGEPTKKTDAEKAAHTVPGDHPRHLIIPSLNVSANILPMGVTANNAIEAPASAWDVGWYSKSALPGSNYGSMILDGHVNDTLNGPGVFYSASLLATGDTIIVERGDMQRLSYRVTSVTQRPVDQVDINALMESVGNTGGLHLITCGGAYDTSRGTYDDRVIVTATRV